MNIRFFIILFVLFVFKVNFIVSKDLQKDIERYKKYPMEDIDQSLELIDRAPNDVKRNLTDKLREFYLSDPSEKKILQRQNVNTGFFLQKKINREWNSNIQRLFIKDLMSQSIEGFHIIEAPNIAKMHLKLAEIYMKQKDSYHASYHYSQALRYRTLKMSSDVFVNENRLSLLKKNDPQIEDAKEYEEINRLVREQEIKEQEIKEKNIILRDALRNQKQSNRDILNEQLRKNRELIDSMRQKNRDLIERQKKSEEKYKNYEKKYDKESSQILFDMANLIRGIEDEIKERQKVIYKKSFYKTQFNQTFLHDYSQNRDYTAYSNFLDMASRLDPENAEIPYLLAKEYKLSQKPMKAIYAFHRTLNAEKNVNGQLDKSQFRFVYLNLGGLYYQTKKYVDSAYYYQKAIENTEDEKEKKNLIFQVAKLHTTRTGNYKEAEKLLNEYLISLNSLNPTNPEERAQWDKERFHVFRYLSIVYRKTMNIEKYEESLQEAKASFEDLEKIIEKQRNVIDQSFQKMQNAKQNLLQDTKQEDLSLYNKFKADYEKEKNFLSMLYSMKKSFPLRNIYFSLAEHLEKKPDIKRALDTYRQAEKKGISPDEARRNMERIKRLYGVSL